MKRLTEQQVDDLRVAVLHILSRRLGYGGRIGKQELVGLVNDRPEFLEIEISERQVRSAMEYLKQETAAGSRIVAALTGGYFYAEDKDELEEFLRSDEKRLISLATRIRRQRKAAELTVSRELEIMGQMSLPGEVGEVEADSWKDQELPNHGYAKPIEMDKELATDLGFVEPEQHVVIYYVEKINDEPQIIQSAGPFSKDAADKVAASEKRSTLGRTYEIEVIKLSELPDEYQLSF